MLCEMRDMYISMASTSLDTKMRSVTTSLSFSSKALRTSTISVLSFLASSSSDLR
jgi:hypothetical protein